MTDKRADVAIHFDDGTKRELPLNLADAQGRERRITHVTVDGDSFTRRRKRDWDDIDRMD